MQLIDEVGRVLEGRAPNYDSARHLKYTQVPHA
jgi:hypothetical protein